MFLVRIIPDEGTELAEKLNHSSRRDWDVSSRLIEEAFKLTDLYDLCQKHDLFWRVSPLHSSCIQIQTEDEMVLTKLRLML